jgi:hypothetical protein
MVGTLFKSITVREAYRTRVHRLFHLIPNAHYVHSLLCCCEFKLGNYRRPRERNLTVPGRLLLARVRFSGVAIGLREGTMLVSRHCRFWRRVRATATTVLAGATGLAEIVFRE